MKVRDLMTSIPEAVTPDQPVTDAAEIMEELDVGCVPVVEDPETLRLVGMVALADVARRFGTEHPAEVERLLEAISRPSIEKSLVATK